MEYVHASRYTNVTWRRGESIDEISGKIRVEKNKPHVKKEIEKSLLYGNHDRVFNGGERRKVIHVVNTTDRVTIVEPCDRESLTFFSKTDARPTRRPT